LVPLLKLYTAPAGSQTHRPAEILTIVLCESIRMRFPQICELWEILINPSFVFQVNFLLLLDCKNKETKTKGLLMIQQNFEIKESSKWWIKLDLTVLIYSPMVTNAHKDMFTFYRFTT